MTRLDYNQLSHFDYVTLKRLVNQILGATLILFPGWEWIQLQEDL